MSDISDTTFARCAGCQFARLQILAGAAAPEPVGCDFWRFAEPVTAPTMFATRTIFPFSTCFLSRTENKQIREMIHQLRGRLEEAAAEAWEWQRRVECLLAFYARATIGEQGAQRLETAPSSQMGDGGKHDGKE